MAWRGSRARGVFRAPACIAFSRERHRLRSPVAPVREALVRIRLSRRRLSQNMGAVSAGVRSSPRRVRRVMGENGWLAPHRVGRNQEKTHDGTIVTDKINEMWGTDMSQTVTLEEGRAYVFV